MKHELAEEPELAAIAGEWQMPEYDEPSAPGRAQRASAQSADAENEAPEFSEDALAARFTQRHGNDLRYVAAWGRWRQWDGTHWTQDDTLHVFDRAREICRAASVDMRGAKPGTAAEYRLRRNSCSYRAACAS